MRARAVEHGLIKAQITEGNLAEYDITVQEVESLAVGAAKVQKCSFTTVTTAIAQRQVRVAE